MQTYNDWTNKHPFNTWSQSSLDHACLFEYAELHNEQILKALQKVDRARQNLIQAQNGLAHLVYNFNNPYTARMFEAFYLRGGVTADEWKAFFKEHDGRVGRRGRSGNPGSKTENIRGPDAPAAGSAEMTLEFPQGKSSRGSKG